MRSAFLHIGLTEAILAFSEQPDVSKSVFIMLYRCLSITLADSFTVISGLPSGHVAFLRSRR